MKINRLECVQYKQILNKTHRISNRAVFMVTAAALGYKSKVHRVLPDKVAASCKAHGISVS